MRESDDFSVAHGVSNFEGAVDVDRDRVLVERCQGGDLDAFDSLYLHYHQRLLRFCVKRLQERSESEDVVQETFARAWRALPTFAGDRRFYPWLTVIAGNLCTDVLRRRARLTPLDETMMLSSDVGSYDIEDAVLQDVDAQLVTTAFENLKPRHQRVLDLRERSGWSYQRIADQEGVGVSAVETLLWRARNALKREFALLAGAEGKAGALIGVAMTLPRTGIRRLSTSFRNHVPTSFRHAFEAGRHVASAVTPAGASMAAAGAVAVGLGAAFLSPSNSAIATPAAVAPITTTVAPSSGTPGLGGAPPPTTAPALTPGAAPAAGGSAAGGAGSTPSAPSGSAATGGTGNGSSSLPTGTGSLPDPAAGLSQPIGGVAGAVGGVGGAVAGAGAGAGGAVSGLANGVGGAVSGLGGVIGGVGSTGGGTSSGLSQATTGVVGGVVSGAGSGLGQVITGVTGGVNNLLGGAPLG
ncbi:MAG: polymerase sigma-70 factor, subfamily [Acidimicrobiaceae bacterium]|nr:polymerase sigma-70 factor, subfamily [Acidimicrobiaceae bacterium]